MKSLEQIEGLHATANMYNYNKLTVNDITNLKWKHKILLSYGTI